MKYGVLVDGVFQERELEEISAKGFINPMWGRIGTYDEYVMKEIDKSYGTLDVAGHHVLDVGANIGCFTRWAMEHGAVSVVAIEPEPNNFKMLVKNCQEFLTVSEIFGALTPDEQDGAVLYLSPTGKNPGNSSLHPRRGRVTVDVRTVSVKKIMDRSPDISTVKLDCEGAEYGLLPELIKYDSIKQIALEYHINGFDISQAENAHHMMLDNGWSVVREPRIQENLWQTLASYRR